MKFGKILKDLRLEKNLTQAQLAKKADLATSCIAMLENDERTPSANTLISLATALDVSVDYLLGLEEEPEAARLTFEESGAPSDEQKLLSIYHSLSPEMKNTLWGLLATWSPEGATDFLKKNQK